MASILVTWQTSYFNEHGFECILALEGTDTSEVLSEARRILAQMQRQRITPVRSRPIPPRPHRVIGEQHG